MNCIKRSLRAVGAPLFFLRRKRSPVTEEIAVSLPQLPTAFLNYRIAVVSDTHFPDSLCTPQQILDALRIAKPDCIVLAGDLTNRYNTNINMQQTKAFLQDMQVVAPCYAIVGNHEYAPARRAVYTKLLQATNIPLIEDAFLYLEKNGNALPLYCVCDRQLPLPTPEQPYAILLTHYPHQAVTAADSGFALALCGHAHGGQVRLGKRGLFAPGQGLLAKYISGAYAVGNMTVVVSRGLGDSSLPIRIQNSAHLPVVILKSRTFTL